MATDHSPALAALIARLYEAALDEQQWSGMATHIAQAFDATSAVIKISHAVQTSADILQTTDNFAIAQTDPQWADHWHRHDLWVEEAARRQLAGATTSQSLMPDSQLEQTGFYNEWLKPLMIHTMVGALVPLAEDGTGVIGIHRPKGADHFDQHDARKLDALTPHLQQALRLRQHLHQAQLGTRALEQALMATQLAVVAVDSDAKVLFANGPAESLLRSESPLKLTAGRLNTRQAREDAQLQRLIQAACQPRPEPIPGAMRLTPDGPCPLTLTVVPLTRRAHELHATGPAALIMIRGLQGPADRAADTLRQLFALTPAEARVAIALAQGYSPEDIAARSGIGLGTVRTHVKSALAKTGTKRQAQLVALVWHSVGPLPMTALQGDAPHD